MFDTKPTATAPSYPEIREGFSDRSYKHLWADTRVKTIRGSVNKFAKVCRVALDISDPADKPTDSDQIAFQFADILASGKVPEGLRGTNSEGTPRTAFQRSGGHRRDQRPARWQNRSEPPAG
ncbi:hypothetical protein R3X27_23930 [Tropicimonas sp. TH_r6]|uniref:hypothetical protein n=1 Tax=Tropicimonas sp. TH_r6 TaxID=3082085 RepID=UPI00295454EE|nr:hypothetical protein [Tropicimonas sp. TH_r6]MDV7145740.1 hypothetical protein [Tropicimonas sp. TH_r6]